MTVQPIQKRPTRILVVDDSNFARHAVVLCLRTAGFTDAEFVPAKDGAEALLHLQQSTFDLVITDLNMPQLDGKGLIERVRAIPELYDLPIIVVSSLLAPAVEHALRDAGATACVAKPVSSARALQVFEWFHTELTK